MDGAGNAWGGEGRGGRPEGWAACMCVCCLGSRPVGVLSDAHIGADCGPAAAVGEGGLWEGEAPMLQLVRGRAGEVPVLKLARCRAGDAPGLLLPLHSGRRHWPCCCCCCTLACLPAEGGWGLGRQQPLSPPLLQPTPVTPLPMEQVGGTAAVRGPASDADCESCAVVGCTSISKEAAVRTGCERWLASIGGAGHGPVG